MGFRAIGDQFSSTLHRKANCWRRCRGCDWRNVPPISSSDSEIPPQSLASGTQIRSQQSTQYLIMSRIWLYSPSSQCTSRSLWYRREETLSSSRVCEALSQPVLRVVGIVEFDGNHGIETTSSACHVTTEIEASFLSSCSVAYLLFIGTATKTRARTSGYQADHQILEDGRTRQRQRLRVQGELSEYQIPDNS